MAYDPDKTWEDFVREVQQQARATIRTAYEGLELYQDLLNFKAGRTNAQIATALGRSEADIDALAAALTVFKKVHDLGENVAVAQGSYFNDLRTFS